MRISAAVLALFVIGCGGESDPEPPGPKEEGQPKAREVTIQVAGMFKAGAATWMAWPEGVKKALEGLSGVEKVEMIIRADLFVATLADNAEIDEEKMLQVVRDLGYKPLVVDKEKVLAALPEIEDTGKAPDYYVRLREQAKKENKLLVFDCYAEWCAPCKRMVKETFPDPRVKKLLDERCIFVKVDVEKTPEMAMYFATQGLPDIWLHSPEGKLLDRVVGFKNADEFLKILESALDKID